MAGSAACSGGKGRYGLDGPLFVIGDTHFPFADPGWFAAMVDRVAQLQPRYVVQIGDLYDYFCLSRYARSLNLMTPAVEARTGRERAEDMWTLVQSAAPGAECYQILGNHDDRAEKRMLESAPELEAFVGDALASRFEFPGVTTVHDGKEELWIGDIALLHGYKKHGEHARHNQAPTVVGHLHKGAVTYLQNRAGTYWELNVGYGGDPTSPVFSYRNQRALHGWTQGWGVVDAFGPRFEPYDGGA